MCKDRGQGTCGKRSKRSTGTVASLAGKGGAGNAMPARRMENGDLAQTPFQSAERALQYFGTIEAAKELSMNELVQTHNSEVPLLTKNGAAPSIDEVISIQELQLSFNAWEMT